MELPVKVYENHRKQSFLALFKEIVSDIKGSLFLAKQLATRDIKAQYRQSLLGIFWAFIAPLATAAVWIFLNMSGTIQVSETGIPYPVYAFSGTLIWSIITSAINTPTQSTNAAKGLLSKVNFPKEALILSGIYKLLFESSIKIILLVVLIFLFDIGFSWSLLFLPFVIMGAVVFGVMIGLFLTPLSMLYNDIGKIVTMGLSFLMYITPVVYSIPEGGLMKTVMELNPFTPFIVISRDLITGTSPEYLLYFIAILGLTAPLLLLGLMFYRISIPIIVERS